MPETLAAAVYMDPSGSKTIADALGEIEQIPGPPGPPGPPGADGPAGANGSDATVTKGTVEAVLTGDVSTHNHDTHHVKKSGDLITGVMEHGVAGGTAFIGDRYYRLINGIQGRVDSGCGDGGIDGPLGIMSLLHDGVLVNRMLLYKDYTTFQKPVTVASGGTGLQGVTPNSYLKGDGYNALVPRTPAQVLADIGALASANYTAADILAKLLTVDGPGSGLDAATVGGKTAAQLQPKSNLQGSAFGTLITAGTTRYIGLGVGSDAWQCALVTPYAGTLRNLQVITNHGAPGAGQSYTFTVMVDNAETALTCTNSGTSTNQVSNTVNSVAVTAGRRVSLKCVTSSGAAGIGAGLLFCLEYDA